MGEIGGEISTSVEKGSAELPPGGLKEVLSADLAAEERKLAELSKGHENYTPLSKFETPTTTEVPEIGEPTTTSDIEALNRQFQAMRQTAGGKEQSAEEALAARIMAEQLQNKPKNLWQKIIESIKNFFKNFFRRLFFIKS